MRKIKNTNAIKFTAIFLFAFAVSVSGQTFNKPGVTSLQFIKLGVSARAEGMGQSVTAFIDDASAAYYNPSGLMNVKGNDFVVSHTFMPANVGLSFMSYTRRLTDYDAVAVSVIALRTDDMKIRTVLQPEGTGQSFHVADYAFGIHYAHDFTYDLKIGFTFRYVYLTLVSGVYSKGSWTADIGIQYITSLKGILTGLRIGMVVANFGPEIKYINESYGLPLRYTVGISKPVKINENHKLLIGLDWVKSIDEKQKAQLGIEYNFGGFLFVRGGYKFASDAQSWSGGLGVTKAFVATKISVDYAYGAFGDLGNIHRITAKIGF
jgi:hypothetical protein